MFEIENENLIIVIVLIVIFVLFLNSNKEKLENVKSVNPAPSELIYNPKMFQPDVNKQVKDNNYIQLPEFSNAPWKENVKDYGLTDALSPVDMGLNFNMCSKSCCSQQYPPPFSVTPDDFVLMSNKDFVPTSYSCNNGWQDSGCLCMTKEQALFLNRRGNNAYNDV